MTTNAKARRGGTLRNIYTGDLTRTSHVAIVPRIFSLHNLLIHSRNTKMVRDMSFGKTPQKILAKIFEDQAKTLQSFCGLGERHVPHHFCVTAPFA
jgi:hypothetical protein